jgi:hypothetical protein
MHAHRLAKIGVTRYYRATWHTSLEMALAHVLDTCAAEGHAAFSIGLAAP